MKSHWIVLAIVAGLALTGSAAPVAADDAFLSKLVGTWIGRGVTQSSATAEPERVYCKISNTLSPDGNSLLQSGRCSLASNSGAISGAITALDKGSYSGELVSFASKGPATLSGALHGSQLVMKSKFTDRLTNEPVTATNTLALSEGGYTLTTTRADPASGSTFTSSKIAFTTK